MMLPSTIYIDAANKVGPRSRRRLWQVYGPAVQFGDCLADAALPTYPIVSTGDN